MFTGYRPDTASSSLLYDSSEQFIQTMTDIYRICLKSKAQRASPDKHHLLPAVVLEEPGIFILAGDFKQWPHFKKIT